jgi:hypothetical protein
MQFAKIENFCRIFAISKWKSYEIGLETDIYISTGHIVFNYYAGSGSSEDA